MTGHASVETAVQAMRLGAYDYITKPFRIDELKLLLQRMSEKVALVQENQFLRERVDVDSAMHGIVGGSTKMQDVLRMVARLRDTRTPVLITGESGTGKELVARAIHNRGKGSAKQPFVAVDCGALVPTLMESELFGYEKGAFTGALKHKEGLFMAARGGTLFLDEIGELPLDMQAKLLRVLQEREVRPVGSNHPVKVDVRIIAATNRDLEKAYQDGTFRKDLFFRLNVVAIHVPPLRERKADIPGLLHWFLEKYAGENPPKISETAMQALLASDWPGNVRELENCIERAIALGSRTVIDLHDLPPALQIKVPWSSELVSDPHAENAFAPAPQEQPSRAMSAAAAAAPSGAVPKTPNFDVESVAPPRRTSSGVAAVRATDLEEIERQTIRRVFEETNGDKTLTGKMLGISRATLYRKLKRYGIAGNDVSM